MSLALGKDKKIYNIILEKQVKEAIDELARMEDRSSSNLINRLLKKYIEENDVIGKSEMPAMRGQRENKETANEN